MKININKWNGLSDRDKQNILARSETDIVSVKKNVENIIDKVKKVGDKALKELTLLFDNADLSNKPFAVTREEFNKAEEITPVNVKEALQYSIENIRTFHIKQKPPELKMEEIRPGIFAGEKPCPIPSAGLYVPRGRGSFPSMLYMLAVPAKIAEVPEISIVTPPNPDGSVDPASLCAAKLCGIDTVYRIGGAQAIAALAFGTESIKPAAKITGPGSIYVAAAKQLLYGVVDTGLPAGPSESIVLADKNADPWKVSLDLLIEAEHGADSCAILITPSQELAGKVAELIPEIVKDTPEPRKSFIKSVFSCYGRIIIADSMEHASEIVNQFAPEHLQIQTRDPFKTISLIKNAGEILLGDYTPFSLANYSAGANAVLPTGGRAKTFSAVSVRDFIKYSSVVHITKEGYRELTPHVTALADYEGFAMHSRALRERKSEHS